MGLIFDSLMTSSLDERGALYGLVAKSVTISADGNELRFALRPEARFNDGSPLTAKDVVFSLNILKEKGHPTIRQELRDMESVDGRRRRDVVVRLAADAQPRSAADRGAAADLLGGLLRDEIIRGDDARSAAGLGRLQGRAGSSRAATSSSIASRITGARNCR